MLSSAVAAYRRYLEVYSLVAAGGRPRAKTLVSRLNDRIADSHALVAAEALATRDALQSDVRLKSKQEFQEALSLLLD